MGVGGWNRVNNAWGAAAWLYWLFKSPDRPGRICQNQMLINVLGSPVHHVHAMKLFGVKQPSSLINSRVLLHKCPMAFADIDACMQTLWVTESSLLLVKIAWKAHFAQHNLWDRWREISMRVQVSKCGWMIYAYIWFQMISELNPNSPDKDLHTSSRA